MKFLHTMLRVKDLDRALDFYVGKLGLKQIRRSDNEAGKFSLIFLATEEGAPEIELTYNWGQEEEYSVGRNFGHLAFAVDDIYQKCEELEAMGVTINRPPRDGYMAFIRSPDNHSVELLQKGQALPPHPKWSKRENIGTW